jgi:hypothetical protein
LGQLRHRERQEHIIKRAYQLADSGAHISTITIVSTLVAGGYPEAADILTNSIVRDDLNQICGARWAYADSAPAEKSAIAVLSLLQSQLTDADQSAA